MVDGKITPYAKEKGQKLENMLEKCLQEIVRKLRACGIDCYYLFNRKQEGRGNSGPEALLVIHQNGRNYYFYIEAKNHGDYREWSLNKVKENIITKFRKIEFCPSDKNSETIGIVIGHIKTAEDNVLHLWSGGILYLNTGELPLNISSTSDKIYYDKLKGYLLFYISEICENMVNQDSKYEIDIINEDDLIVKNKNKILKKYKINQIKGKGFVYLGPRLMDFFSVGRGKREGIKIVTPWKLITSYDGYSTKRRKIGSGLYCIDLSKSRKTKSETGC